MKKKYNKECPICNIELTDENTKFKDDDPETVRTDSQGLAWCIKCTDEFDSLTL